MFLCKPNKETIAELSEAYGKDISTNYNGIHELSFKLPYVIEKNKKFIRNDHVDMLRGHFLIRYEVGSTKEYFIISKPRNSTDDGREVKEVSCFLLPYELNKKIIRNYKETKKLYDEFGSDGILNETLLYKSNWKIGYINEELKNTYRSIDVSEQSLVTFISDLCETYDCVVKWDTVNRTVSFYKHSEIGTDKGLSIEHGKYLRSIEEDPDFDNVTTRLYVYGKDNISINKFNPTGSDFIESFAYYMYPFERDASKNVIKHSNYMSDSLCHALLDYDVLLESKRGQFNDLLTQKEGLLATLFTKQNELDTLNSELIIIQDNIDLALADKASTTTLENDKATKQSEIDVKQSEIDTINLDLDTVDSEVISVSNSISLENNFTPEQIEERSYYINEEVWLDNNYYDEKELYDEGIKRLKRISQPIISYRIDIVDFLKVVECQRDWSKLVLGDIVTIKYPNFNINIKAKIVSIRRNEDDNTIELEIANADDIKNGFVQLKDFVKTATSSSKQLDMYSSIWNKSEENETKLSEFINSKFDATKNQIQAGVNQLVEITRRGVVVRDPNDPNTYLVLQNGVMAITKDNGKTWGHAITKDGIVGERIWGRQIISESGIFEGIEILDSSGNKIVEIGKYIDDVGDNQLGIKINGGSLEIVNGLPENQLNESSVTKWNSAESNANEHTNLQITEVNTVTSNLQTQISDFSSDGKFTLAEANSLEVTLLQVKKESIDLINIAASLEITTEKVNYETSLSELDTELTTNWINQSSYPLDVTATQRTVIITKLENVQNTKSILINKIGEIRDVNVKGYVDKQIGEVNTSIANLESDIDTVFSDASLTNIEANSLENTLAQVKKESNDLITVATGLDITTEKTNYSSSLTSLETEINKWVNQLSYPMTITETERTNIQTALENVQDAKSKLINKIAIIRENNATSVANTAQDSADQAQTDANAANSKLTEIASDSKLTPSEKQATKKEWDIIVSEKPLLELQANSFGVTTEKVNYTNSYDSLNTYLSTLLSDLTVTSDIVGNDFRLKFKTYYDNRTTLLNKISDVTKSVADNSIQQDASYNNVKINSTNGLVVTNQDATQTKVNGDGVEVQGGNITVYDEVGNLVMDGRGLNPLETSGWGVTTGLTFAESSFIPNDYVEVRATSSISSTTALPTYLYLEDVSKLGSYGRIYKTGTWGKYLDYDQVDITNKRIRVTYNDAEIETNNYLYASSVDGVSKSAPSGISRLQIKSGSVVLKNGKYVKFNSDVTYDLPINIGFTDMDGWTYRVLYVNGDGVITHVSDGTSGLVYDEKNLKKYPRNPRYSSMGTGTPDENAIVLGAILCGTDATKPFNSYIFMHPDFRDERAVKVSTERVSLGWLSNENVEKSMLSNSTVTYGSWAKSGLSMASGETYEIAVPVGKGKRLAVVSISTTDTKNVADDHVGYGAVLHVGLKDPYVDAWQPRVSVGYGNYFIDGYAEDNYGKYIVSQSSLGWSYRRIQDAFLKIGADGEVYLHIVLHQYTGSETRHIRLGWYAM